MRALVLEDFGKISLREIDRPPPPGPDEVEVRISYTGICGSDIHGYTGENGRRVPGQVMGHETVGRVRAVGSEVTEVTVGQVVTFNPLVACGRCEACLAGSEQHCPDKVVIGVRPSTVAAFAENVIVPERNVVQLPDSVTETHGALIEPLAVALHAGRRAGVKEGDAVLVTGGGPIGQSAILAAIRLGARRVLATDIAPSRRELCAALGADVIDPTVAPVAQQVVARLGGPVDVTIDAVGVAATLADALESTKLGGTVGLVGMGSPELVLSAYQVSTGERTLVGSFCYDARTFRDAAAWVAEGHSMFDRLIAKVVPMDAADAAFAELAGTSPVAGKVLVDLRGGGDQAPMVASRAD